MKLLWSSVAPWLPTGYGQQTGIFTRKLKELGHDVAIAAYVGLEGIILEGGWHGMTVYPGDLTRMNKLSLKTYVKRHAGDGDPLDVQVIALTDVWTWLESRYGGIADFKGLKLAAWTPVDHDPCPAPVANALRLYDARAIAMSRFGQEALVAEGIDALYVPHGIDTKALRPRPERTEIRESMGIPADAFVVGMVANNQGNVVPRKGFPQAIEAFSAFHAKHDDAYLYLHTDMSGINQGLDMTDLLEGFGVPRNAYGHCRQDNYWLGEYNTAHMGCVYSTFDVLLNPSYGEGFGIPLVEAQACGVPVIATEHTAMPELVGRGWLVDGFRWFHHEQNAFWKIPAVDGILDALEAAYDTRGDQAMRDEARQFALQFDADHVTREHWAPALEALSRPREVAPLTNRAQRRAGRKQRTAA